MVECRYYSVMEKLASLAKIKLSEEEVESLCRDLERTAEFLRTVSEISRELEVNPLYYVWDQWGPLREPGEPRTIDIAGLHVSLKEGYVRVPWRGGKLEEA
jgi:Asp-tRNA(Asn)/Glu-tRNA(Gln) amidotransferase C subunit